MSCMDLKVALPMDQAYTLDALGKKKEALYIFILKRGREEIIGTLRSATRQARRRELQNVKTQCELVMYSKEANVLSFFYLTSKMLQVCHTLSLSTSSKYDLIKTPYIT